MLPLLPLPQSLRRNWRFGVVGLLVLCAATMHGQVAAPLAGASLPGSPGLADVSAATGLALAVAFEADADSSATSDRALALSAPVIAMQPADRTVPEGAPATFSVSVDRSDVAALSFQWRVDGIAIPGANTASYTIGAAGPADAGDYTCDVQTGEGAQTSRPATLTVIPAAQTSRFVNFSAVTSVDAAGPEAMLGYAVGGAGTSGAKSILVRAVGPSLARFGTPHPNPAPRIELFTGATKTGENDHWDGQAAVTEAAARVGAFPLGASDSADAAMLIDAAGHSSITIKISGQAGATGVVLAEIYDATPAAAVTMATPRLVKFSALERVAAGANVSVGFVIAGQTPKTVLVRVVGPALTDLGVAAALPDPVLTLFQGVTPIAVNDNWGGTATLQSAFGSVGALALDPSSKDAALVMTLANGSYAVQASEASNAGGIALVEIYELP